MGTGIIRWRPRALDLLGLLEVGHLHVNLLLQLGEVPDPGTSRLNLDLV